MSSHHSRFGPPIEKVEFKVTVLPKEESAVFDVVGRSGAAPAARRVFFFDTLDLDLADAHLFLRARETEGDDDDSTVKLRPLPDSGVPAEWDAAPKRRIEADAVGTRLVTSAKLDGKPDAGDVDKVASGDRKPSTLFNDAQEALVAGALPDGTELKDLAVLGPVQARKWELPDSVFPLGLAVEEWTVDGGLHFVELSFKSDPADAPAAEQAFHGFLRLLDIGIEGDPEPKTMKVLKHLRDLARVSARSAP
jgi:hypothetical protein